VGAGDLDDGGAGTLGHAALGVRRGLQPIQGKARVETSSEVPLTGKGLAVGESKVLTETEDLTIQVTMVDSDTVESVYRHKPNGDVILRRTDSETNGVSLDEFDAFYWTVLVDNMPATASQMAALDEKPFAFKADHRTRILHLKIEE
jgi:hypothetical protein